MFKLILKKSFLIILVTILILLIVIFSILYLYIFKKQQNNSIFSFINTNNNLPSPAPTIDTSPILITNKSEIQLNTETLSATYSLFISTNKPITLGNQSKAKLHNVGKNKYVIEIIQLIEGENNIKIELIDEKNHNNIETINFNITRKKATPIQEWPNYKYTDASKDLAIVVDKRYKLPHSYIPQDLVEINKAPYYLYTNTAGLRLRKPAADALKEMLDEYYKTFKEQLVVASAYRSYNEQHYLYLYWVETLGAKEADQVSARPGYSEHQLGTAVDFIDQDSGYQLTEEFAKTKSFKWLSQNAHKYGFVLSYPKDQENLTGYKFEPWHWRYIGKELAIKYKDNNSTTLNYWLESINSRENL